ncbi:MAG: hypothetical protein [Arizlama microvirus]|nr:MAG: hypothetical protein [Arizlama microvirus]
MKKGALKCDVKKYQKSLPTALSKKARPKPMGKIPEVAQCAAASDFNP